MSTALQQRPQFFQLRASEFARLDAEGHTYLDFAGSALYPASLVKAHGAFLDRAVLGNPHSDSPSSRASSDLIAGAQARVLRFFGADPAEYAVVFTANASAAIHLVASAFPFQPESSLVLTADNHNSVNGIREYAARAGARVRYIELDESLRAVNAEHAFKTPRMTAGHSSAARAVRRSAPSLFAFPAQSNFSGVQHPLRLISAAQQRGYRVLLDAAAFTPTHALSLREDGADFVAISFYKMFGYPTGVGALIARHDALAELQRPWFAGGTVDFVSVQNMMHRLKDGPESFEDGTANFLGIAAVPAGLDFLDTIGMARIERHVAALTAEAIDQLRAMRAEPGRAGVVLYGPHDAAARGATIAFNLAGPDGVILPYEVVEAHARAAAISIRGGCFCNPGAAEIAFALPRARMLNALHSDQPFSIPRLRQDLGGSAVGALRCSFGIPTTRRDIARLIELLRSILDRQSR